MILLWGIPGDEPLAMVRAALDRQDSDYVFLDQERAGSASLELEVGKAVRGRLTVDELAVDLEEVHALYLRPHASRHVQSPRHALSLEDGLLAWTEVTPAMVLNRPSAMASNNSKPYQAVLIRKAGFAVPETLVTTDPQAAAELWARHGDVIYKSVSGVRSIVSRLKAEHRGRLANVAHCPTQFQQYIRGQDWRVHVVGDEVFPSTVLSAADDYRYAGRSGHDVEIVAGELPAELTCRCLQLSRKLHLPLCGIDLRCTPEGEWYCFEVNPSPGFSFYESATAQPIAAAIARYLQEAGNARARSRTEEEQR